MHWSSKVKNGVRSLGGRQSPEPSRSHSIAVSNSFSVLNSFQRLGGQRECSSARTIRSFLIRDCREGRVEFDQSPDSAVYSQVVLRDYLKHRSEESLFEADRVLEQLLKLPTSAKPRP